MNKLYVCTEDRQGGTFAVGSIHTIEGWRQRAMTWADSDDNEGMVDYLQELKAEHVIGEIDSTWEITLVALEDIIPLNKYSVVEDIHNLLGYICNNIVALRTMQQFLEEQDEEYAEYTKDILDRAMGIVEETYGEDEEIC
jgi:hypothetical protein